MTLGEKIQELRKANGLSQELLAERLKVSRQSISKWENSLSTPSSENLFRLAELFHVSADQLMHPSTRVELVMDVRRGLATMKKQSKSIFVFVGMFILLFLGTLGVAIYGKITSAYSEQVVLYLVLASVGLMLLAFLPIFFIILKFVYRDCKKRGIKPTFWVIISATIIGLVYYLIKRDSLTKVGGE